jgi:hypothetical protein
MIPIFATAQNVDKRGGAYPVAVPLRVIAFQTSSIVSFLKINPKKVGFIAAGLIYFIIEIQTS